jgi:hypothetical protein
MGFILRPMTCAGVGGHLAGQGDGQSAGPATARKHCQADAPKTGISFADGGALRCDRWSGFGFGVFWALFFR